MTVMQTPLLYSWRWPLALTILFCFVFTSASISIAETRPAFVTTELQENEKIWPGQQQILYVKLYTLTSFSGSPRFELPRVSGMLIMESEERPLLGTEKVNGVSYMFKQLEISLFPLRAGSLSVPPFSVEFGFRDQEGKVAEQNFSTDELHFTVKAIPGIDPGRAVITTSKLLVDDHWQPKPGEAKVGDAFTRTITMTADDLPGMAFPPFAVKKINGLGVYSKQPQVTDHKQRGESTGKRIETISYVCEQQGTFTVPGAQIQWWNPEKESLQNIVLEPVELTVAANPLLQKETPAEPDVSQDAGVPWKWLLILLFSGSAGAVFIRLRRKKKQPDSQEKNKENQENKEKELFKEFKKVSTTHDGAATMQALLHWLDYTNFTGGSGSLARFIELADDQELTTQINALETTLYANGQEQQWSGDTLYNTVHRARKKLRQGTPLAVQHSLPSLNP